jgi:hypothetical protein
MQVSVNTVMNLWVPKKKGEEFLDHLSDYRFFNKRHFMGLFHG